MHIVCLLGCVCDTELHDHITAANTISTICRTETPQLVDCSVKAMPDMMMCGCNGSVSVDGLETPDPLGLKAQTGSRLTLFHRLQAMLQQKHSTTCTLERPQAAMVELQGSLCRASMKKPGTVLRRRLNVGVRSAVSV